MSFPRKNIELSKPEAKYNRMLVSSYVALVTAHYEIEVIFISIIIVVVVNKHGEFLSACVRLLLTSNILYLPVDKIPFLCVA